MLTSFGSPRGQKWLLLWLMLGLLGATPAFGQLPSMRDLYDRGVPEPPIPRPLGNTLEEVNRGVNRGLGQIKLPDPRQWVQVQNNIASVQADLRQGWDFVVFGSKISHADYAQFAAALAAAVATENPGPVQAYLTELANRSIAELQRNLTGEARRVLPLITERLLFQALVNAERGRPLIQIQGLDVDVRVASYNWWKKVSGDYPEINQGTLRWKRMEQEIPLPNEHQPVIRIRLRLQDLRPAPVLGNPGPRFGTVPPPGPRPGGGTAPVPFVVRPAGSPPAPSYPPLPPHRLGGPFDILPSGDIVEVFPNRRGWQATGYRAARVRGPDGRLVWVAGRPPEVLMRPAQ